MQRETIALYADYVPEAGTKAVAVPIYETVAYALDSSEHGGVPFDPEAKESRYDQISNATISVLEKRVALLEGGVASLCITSGQAALHPALLNFVEMGSNIVLARAAEEAIDRPIGQDTKSVFCVSVNNPAGSIWDIQSLTEAARVRLSPVVDNTVATPVLLRPIEFGADIIVHSLTKFLGGHGTTLGGAVKC